MAKCKNCLHVNVCDELHFNLAIEAERNCGHFQDRSKFIELPCKPGTHLWRVTTPYRDEPKVTEFVVKNYRTVGKCRQLQLEVQAINVPGTNWMRYQDFYKTCAEAESVLAERRIHNGH